MNKTTQQVKKLLTGLKVEVTPLMSGPTGTEEESAMARVRIDIGARFEDVEKRLINAGFTFYAIDAVYLHVPPKACTPKVSHHRTKHVCTLDVIDPDTKNPVEVRIRKDTVGGAMVGLDGSWLDSFDAAPFSPYDDNTVLTVPSNERASKTRGHLFILPNGMTPKLVVETESSEFGREEFCPVTLAEAIETYNKVIKEARKDRGTERTVTLSIRLASATIGEKGEIKQTD